MDTRQWSVLHLLCTLLVHAYLSLAAAEGVNSMSHGGHV